VANAGEANDIHFEAFLKSSAGMSQGFSRQGVMIAALLYRISICPLLQRCVEHCVDLCLVRELSGNRDDLHAQSPEFRGKRLRVRELAAVQNHVGSQSGETLADLRADTPLAPVISDHLLRMISLLNSLFLFVVCRRVTANQSRPADSARRSVDCNRSVRSRRRLRLAGELEQDMLNWIHVSW